METKEPSSLLAMTFLTVAEAGSITAAAEHLRTSKSQVSKQLSRLEAELSVQLLFRTTRRLILTEAGHVYLGYCFRLRELLRESKAAMGELTKEISGLVRLTAPPMFAGSFMVELLLAFHARHPAVRVELDISAQERELEQSGFDLAIRSAEILPPQLVARPLFLTRDWVVAAPAWLEREGEPMHPSDLEQRHCVVHSQYHGGARWLFTQAGRDEEVTVGHWLQVGNYSLNERLAEHGAGFARLPDFAAASAVRSGRLRRVLAAWETPARTVYLLFPKKKPLPAKTRALIQFIEAWFTSRSEVV